MKGTWRGLAVAAIAMAWLATSGVANAQEQKAPPPKAAPAAVPKVAPAAPPKVARKPAPKVELPAAIKTAFETAYPKAIIKNVSTEKEGGELHYEVESIDGTMARDLIYRADGTVVEMEEKIAETDLPQPVRDALAAKYPEGKGKVLTAERLTRGALVLYEIHVRVAKKTHEVTYDPTGALVTTARPERSEKRPEKKQ